MERKVVWVAVKCFATLLICFMTQQLIIRQGYRADLFDIVSIAVMMIIGNRMWAPNAPRNTNEDS